MEVGILKGADQKAKDLRRSGRVLVCSDSRGPSSRTASVGEIRARLPTGREVHQYDAAGWGFLALTRQT